MAIRLRSLIGLIKCLTKGDEMVQKNKTKIYFWIKLDENFFKNLAIKNLRRTVSGGDSLVLIYQQMLLSSLPNNGVIYYEGTLQDVAQEIALNLDEKLDDIKLTIDYFQKAGLLQIGDDGSAEMLQVPMLIGQETNWNKYKREKKLEKFQPTSNQVLTEIDIEKEKEKEKEIEKEIDTDSLFDNYFQIFSEFTKGTKPQPRIDAMHEFSALLPEQRDKALIGANNYVTWYRNSGNDIKYSKNAAVFLKDMIFFDYQEVPEDKSGYDPELGF